MVMRVILITLATAGAISAQDADPEAGREIYMSYCVQCHGFDARGAAPWLVFAPPLTGRVSKMGNG